jgi:apoptosis-inducing factor 2
MHNIVILGGNYAGVGTAHQLLRHVIPLLNSSKDATKHFKVTLVSISDYTYFRVGAPRVLSSPQKAPIEKLFTPISESFRKYKSSEFTFVHGEAIGLNEDQKTVSVKNDGVANIFAIQYTLVVATGTTTNPLWKVNGDRAITIAAFQDIHRRLPNAKLVVVAGGGPTGVEVAAEIAHFYPSTDVTILSGTTRLLSRVKTLKSQRQRRKIGCT